MICVDASPAVHRKAGLGRYAEELIVALQAQSDPLAQDLGVFYHDATDAPNTAFLHKLPRIITAQKPYPWRLRALLAQLLNLNQNAVVADQPVRLFHATEHLLPRFKGIKTVFTLHDLIFKFFPQYHLPRNWIFLQVAMPLFLRRADAVICVSEHTRRDAQKLYRLPEHKTRVIYEGVHPRFRPMHDRDPLEAVRLRYQLPQRYVLAVGTIEPRKNLITLFNAFQHALANDSERKLDDVHLVIVGKQGWLYEETMQAVRQRGLQERVRFTGWLPDEDLPAVYALAQAVAMPSVYEGFGFPALEGLACGVPVLCANASSLPEMVGAAALLLPPLDVAAWAAALPRVLSDVDLRTRLSAAGPLQAALFTWSRAAQQTLEVYRTLLG